MGSTFWAQSLFLAFGEWRKLEETDAPLSAFVLAECFLLGQGESGGGLRGCAGGEWGTIARENTAAAVVVVLSSSSFLWRIFSWPLV